MSMLATALTLTAPLPRKRAPTASAISSKERFTASTVTQTMDLEEVNEHNGKKAENRARPWRTRPQIGFSRQSHTRTQSLKWREGNAERSAERRYGAQNLLDDRHRSRHRRRYHPAPMVGSVFHHSDCLFRLVGGLSERLVLEAIRPELSHYDFVMVNVPPLVQPVPPASVQVPVMLLPTSVPLRVSVLPAGEVEVTT